MESYTSRGHISYWTTSLVNALIWNRQGWSCKMGEYVLPTKRLPFAGLFRNRSWTPNWENSMFWPLRKEKETSLYHEDGFSSNHDETMPLLLCSSCKLCDIMASFLLSELACTLTTFDPTSRTDTWSQHIYKDPLSAFSVSDNHPFEHWLWNALMDCYQVVTEDHSVSITEVQ